MENTQSTGNGESAERANAAANAVQPTAVSVKRGARRARLLSRPTAPREPAALPPVTIAELMQSVLEHCQRAGLTVEIANRDGLWLHIPALSAIQASPEVWQVVEHDNA